MRIGIDLTGLWRQHTGIFRYAASLTPALLQRDDGIEYILFVRRGSSLPPWPAQAPFRIIQTPWTNERLATQLWFPLVRQQLRITAIHYPAFPPPLLQHHGLIASIHDLTVFRHPATMTRVGRLYWRPTLLHAARVGCPVLVPTRAIQTDLFTYTNAKPQHIVITPYAADPRFGCAPSKSLSDHIRHRWQLPERFILAVGTLEPRKNLHTLVAALRWLAEHNLRIPLVIVGRPGWGKPLPPIPGVPIQFTGYVTDEELIAFYHLASLFVYPSLYEGFGFPILEAFWAGCPVITTATSSLPEVAGGAAVLVPPKDVSALAQAIDELWHDVVSARRLIAAGKARAQQFSWATCAAQTAAAYCMAHS